MHEYARPGLEPPRRQEREGFLLFLPSFASFAPSRFKPPEPPKRAVHETDANTRMHECARPGSASFQLAQRKSLLEPPRRQEREGLLTSFLCGLCAFAVQIPGTAKAGRPRSGREYTNARIRPARWRKFPTYRENRSWNRQDAKGAKVFFFFFLPLRPLRLRGSDFGTAKTRRLFPCPFPPHTFCTGHRAKVGSACQRASRRRWPRKAISPSAGSSAGEKKRAAVASSPDCNRPPTISAR